MLPVMKGSPAPKKKSQIDLYVIEKVKEKRIAAKMSQADLAYELGVSNAFIGRVESPSTLTRYNFQHINKIAAILDCNLKDFLPEKPV
jgi:transcriptional regulator with XRE-family HTH domain